MNPILIDLGFFQIRWYAVIILIAISIGYLIIKKNIKKKDIPSNFIFDLCFYVIIFALIGARIYYCLFNFNYYSKNILDVFKVWEGGLAIHGGIIAGIITIFVYSKKQNISFLCLLDIFAPALILGQAIGRWGNFFNMEAYGPSTTLETLKNLFIPNFVIEGMYINNAYHHPTFYYESLGCLTIFFIIMLIKNNKRIKEGHITALYFIGYGLLRFAIESLRQDSLMLYNFKIAQIISILMILTGTFLFIKSLFIKN